MKSTIAAIASQLLLLVAASGLFGWTWSGGPTPGPFTNWTCPAGATTVAIKSSAGATVATIDCASGVLSFVATGGGINGPTGGQLTILSRNTGTRLDTNGAGQGITLATNNISRLSVTDTAINLAAQLQAQSGTQLGSTTPLTISGTTGLQQCTCPGVTTALAANTCRVDTCTVSGCTWTANSTPFGPRQQDTLGIVQVVTNTGAAFGIFSCNNTTASQTPNAGGAYTQTFDIIN